MAKEADQEVDLIHLIREIWSKRIFVFKVSTVFIAIGLIIAFTSKVEYIASCRLLPESQEGNLPDLGGFGGLAGLAGINLDMKSSGVLTPELYPEIVRSTTFLTDMINAPIYFEKLDTTLSSYNYLKDIDRPSLLGWIKKYTIGLPGQIRKLFISSSNDYSGSNDEMLRLSKDDWEIIQDYSDRLSVSVDERTGIIDIQTELPDPLAAAKTTAHLVEVLTERVTDYKIEKARQELIFIENQFLEVKEEYERKQHRLARFTDRNRNITTSIVQTEYQRLQNEMDISFEVYKGLASQLEQAKIKVKEETPVFTVLEPVRIPEDKAKPSRMVIMIIFTFLGVFTAIFYILLAPLIFGKE